MLALILAFREIMFFRGGPQSLPDSQPLLLLSGFAYLLSGWPVVADTPLALFVECALLVGWCFALLGFFSLVHRWRQTLAAMFGTGVIFNLLTVAVIGGIEIGLPIALWSSLLVIVLLWAVAVHGYILGEALSKSFGFGVALAVVYFLLSGFVAQSTGKPSEPPPTEVVSSAG